MDFNANNEPVLCYLCCIEHPLPKSGQFPPNLAIAEVIEANVCGLEFGKEHTEAKESCMRLDDCLTKIEHMLIDPFNFIYEAIEFLKNVIQLKGDSTKPNNVIISHYHSETMALGLERLDKYKSECKSKLKSSEYLKESKRFEQEIEATRKRLNEWLNTLNEFKWNEDEWRKIKRKSERTMKRMQIDLMRFSDFHLLQKRYNEFRFQIEQAYGKFAIEPAFNLE
jgi:hypothetical protein